MIETNCVLSAEQLDELESRSTAAVSEGLACTGVATPPARIASMLPDSHSSTSTPCKEDAAGKDLGFSQHRDREQAARRCPSAPSPMG
jgi:hypothetical protein